VAGARPIEEARARWVAKSEPPVANGTSSEQTPGRSSWLTNGQGTDAPAPETGPRRWLMEDGPARASTLAVAPEAARWQAGEAAPLAQPAETDAQRRDRRAAAVAAYFGELSDRATAGRAAGETLTEFAEQPSAGSDDEVDRALLRLTRLKAAERSLVSPTRGGWPTSAPSAPAEEGPCAKTPDLLVARAEGELNRADAESFERHLADCLDCRAAELRVNRAERAFAAVLQSGVAAELAPARRISVASIRLSPSKPAAAGAAAAAAGSAAGAAAASPASVSPTEKTASWEPPAGASSRFAGVAADASPSRRGRRRAVLPVTPLGRGITAAAAFIVVAVAAALLLSGGSSHSSNVSASKPAVPTFKIPPATVSPGARTPAPTAARHKPARHKPHRPKPVSHPAPAPAAPTVVASTPSPSPSVSTSSPPTTTSAPAPVHSSPPPSSSPSSSSSSSVSVQQPGLPSAAAPTQGIGGH
jgi:hypothetical protein